MEDCWLSFCCGMFLDTICSISWPPEGSLSLYDQQFAACHHPISAIPCSQANALDDEAATWMLLAHLAGDARPRFPGGYGGGAPRDSGGLQMSNMLLLCSASDTKQLQHTRRSANLSLCWYADSPDAPQRRSIHQQAADIIAEDAEINRSAYQREPHISLAEAACLHNPSTIPRTRMAEQLPATWCFKSSLMTPQGCTCRGVAGGAGGAGPG